MLGLIKKHSVLYQLRYNHMGVKTHTNWLLTNTHLLTFVNVNYNSFNPLSSNTLIIKLLLITNNYSIKIKLEHED